MTEVLTGGGSWTERLVDAVNNFEYVPGQMPVSDARVVFGLSFAYLVGVGILRFLFKGRPAMKLETVTIVHNLIMAVGSAIMFIGMVSSFIGILLRHNFSGEVVFCDAEQKEVNKGPLYFWVFIFYLSKYYEWFDTFLIISKQHKLTFLHVYHHWVTMLLVWMCLEEKIPVQWSAQILNTFVHMFMYYYYFLVSLKQEVWWKKHITQLQIAQFILTNALHFVAFGYHYLLQGHCNSFNGWGNQIGLVIINSYLFLFLRNSSRSTTFDLCRKAIG
jgi:hypothetical protein